MTVTTEVPERRANGLGRDTETKEVSMQPKSICSVEGCDKFSVARRLCAMHWARWRRHGDANTVFIPPAPQACSIEGCTQRAHGRGWCRTHYSRWRLYGDPVAPWRNKTSADRQAKGMSGTRTYKSWVSMRERCLNPNFHRYHRYGGRGITICARWLKSFSFFYEDMGERPKDMTLDRIDPDGNYEPSNCRWATNEVQAANRSHKAAKNASL